MLESKLGNFLNWSISTSLFVDFSNFAMLPFEAFKGAIASVSAEGIYGASRNKFVPGERSSIDAKKQESLLQSD